MKALLQQALAALEMPCDRYNGTQAKIVGKAIESLRAAIAQPESEPESEPVAWFDIAVNENIAAVVMIGGVEKHKLKSGDKLYTRPAQPYVPLTDAQIEVIAIEHEAFGFGRVDAKGLTTHGFDPDGLKSVFHAIERAMRGDK